MCEYHQGLSMIGFTLAKLFGIYFKNLFICIDEFVLQVPDILDILGRFLVFTTVYHALMED